MEKKIQDYLHFYLPVAVELDNGGSKVYNRMAVAVGNTDDEYRYVTLRMGKGTKSFTHSVLLSDNRVKPLLRPLSSMTEEETLTAFHMSFEDAGYRFDSYSKEEFGWRARNQNGMECYLPKNTFIPEVTRYLLSRGFDLFGLIDAGLALDKTQSPN